MQESQTKSRYRPTVRIGNWFEDNYCEEEEIKQFQYLRNQSQLLVKKTRHLFVNFHTEIELDVSSDNIRFDAVVQIIAAQMDICKNKNSSIIVKPALSVTINEKVVACGRQISDRCELTVAPNKKPCIRNSFMIVSCDDKDRSNKLLKYGQHFRLQCVDAEEQPLYLYSAQKSPDLTSMIDTTFDTRKRGEINLPLGLCLAKNCGAGKTIPSAYTRWRCVHIEPHRRFETEGHPVPSNSPLIISHAATNKNLAAENIVVQTLFGPEFLACVQNYTDGYKRNDWQNIWMICIGNEHKANE